MFNIALKGIVYALSLASEILENLDKDATGWDDTAARCVDLLGVVVEKIADGKYDKGLVLAALEIAETIAENLDSNTTGVDDQFAQWIKQLREKIDLG